MRQIEAEGSELILKNKSGDHVIVPKKYRQEVLGMIKDGCHGCIDNLVSTLPVMSDYAEDGSVITFGKAFSTARKAGLKEFDWNNNKYTTTTAKEAISKGEKQWIYKDQPNYMGNKSIPNTPVTQINKTISKPLEPITQPVAKSVEQPITPIQKPASQIAKSIVKPVEQQNVAAGPYDFPEVTIYGRQPKELQPIPPDKKPFEFQKPGDILKPKPFGPSDLIVGKKEIVNSKPIIQQNKQPIVTKPASQIKQQGLPSNLPEVTVTAKKEPIRNSPIAKQIQQPVIENKQQRLPSNLPEVNIIAKKQLPTSNKELQPIIGSKPIKLFNPGDFFKEMNIKNGGVPLKIDRNLPNDIQSLVKEKQSNPSFKTFNNKYFAYSKEDGNLYLFDNKHRLIDYTPAGRGQAKGDDPNTSDVNSKGTIAGAGATTPAGAGRIGYIDKSDKTIKEYGSPTYDIMYNDPKMWDNNLALHAIFPGEKEMRSAIINNPNIVDKLVSWGCINVPNEWLQKNEPARNDSIFITKELAQNIRK